MKTQLVRSLSIVVAAVGLAIAIAGHRAAAQPTPGQGSGSGSGSDADSKIYNCKTNATRVDVNFKPEMEIKDLIAWVQSFTCRSFILDPRIVSTGKKVTILASKSMDPTEAHETVLVALSTAGLTVGPQENG